MKLLFLYSQYLYLFIILIPISFIFFIKYKRLYKTINYYNIKINSLKTKFLLELIILFLFLSFLILIKSKLSFSKDNFENDRKDFDLSFCLDISNSMQADDIKPTRLNKSINLIKMILKKFENTKFNLVIFKGSSYILTPFTYDKINIYNNLNYLKDIKNISEGSDIVIGLNTALNSFLLNNSNKIIILISDGEQQNINNINLLNSFKNKNINLITIGIGTQKGVKININGNYLLDKNNNFIISKLNEDFLIKITNKFKGKYFNYKNDNDILEIINYINSFKDDNNKFILKNKIYDQYFIILSIFLFCLYLNKVKILKINI